MVSTSRVFRFYTKKCFVALERLDEKSLNKCLQQYGLRLATQNSAQRFTRDTGIINQTNRKSNKSKRRRRRRNPQDEFPTGNGRKRRKIKPLYYSDDENCDEKGESAENLNYGSQVLSELNDSKICLNESARAVSVAHSEQEEGSNDKVLTTAEMGSPECGVRQKQVQKEERSDSPLKNAVSQEDLDCGASDNCPSGEESDLEVIKMCAKNIQNPRLTVTSDAAELEDDECDVREVDEDDRVTIIFERSPGREIFEEKEVVTNKFKNRGITNRKKQKLIKFKRKSMTGINLAKIERKTKNKPQEGPVEQLKVPEKSVECVSEECLREVCCLVKRLHELSKIILLLQKELPTNGELTLHFSRVINAEQENFHREIRKSQKTIIKCYEKMLSFFKDTSRVAFEIGKRTCLSVEDVVHVISLCIHIEGQCETEKPRNAGKQAIFPPAPPSDVLHKMISDNLVKILRQKLSQRENSAVKQQTTRSSSGPRLSQSKEQSGSTGTPLLSDTQSRQQIVDTSSSAPATQRNVPLGNFRNRPNYAALEHPARVLHPSSASVADSWTPSHNPNIPGKCNSTGRPPRNCLLEPYYRDTVNMQMPQHMLNPMNQRPSGILTQQKMLRDQPTAPCGFPDETARPHQAFTYYNNNPASFIPQRRNNPPMLYEPRNNPSLLLRILVPADGFPPKQALENSKTVITTVANNIQNNVFPSVKSHNSDGANLTKRVPSGGIQFPASVRVLDDNRLFVNPAELFRKECRSTWVINSAGRVVQEVLDPTIPQKLTMKNSRLQAGPVLDLEADKKVDKSISTIDESTEERTTCDLDREDSESRVYVCALNECKNPGVRICTGCHSVIYCSETCQCKHWTLKHKTECYQLKALRG